MMKEEFIQFVRQIYNKNDGFIPLHEPRFVGNEKEYVIETIDSTFVSSVGKYVDQFELMLAEYTGAKYAIALVNGTNALHLALLLAGVEKGDEVITQPLSFIATANAITYCQAIPHFVDVDKDTLGLSPQILKNHLKEIAIIKDNSCYNKLTGRRISACVPMHTFGLPLRIDEINEVCKEFKIQVVEDAAESIGSIYKNKHTGTFGLFGTFSFNGNKTITSGGGGALVTNDEYLAKKAKHLSTQAKIPHQWEYKHDAIGFNYRMPNINAALACAQLEKLPDFILQKRKLSNQYKNFFSSFKDVSFIEEIKDTQSNYWLNAIKLKNYDRRNEFLEYTNDNGIMTRPIWNLLSDLTMFKDSPRGDLSNAKFLEERIVNITSSVIV